VTGPRALEVPAPPGLLWLQASTLPKITKARRQARRMPYPGRLLHRPSAFHPRDEDLSRRTRLCLQNHISPKTRGKAPVAQTVVRDRLSAIPLPIPFILTRNGVRCRIVAVVYDGTATPSPYTSLCARSAGLFDTRVLAVSGFLHSPVCFAHLPRVLADTFFQLPCAPLETEEGLVWLSAAGSSRYPEEQV